MGLPSFNCSRAIRVGSTLGSRFCLVTLIARSGMVTLSASARFIAFRQIHRTLIVKTIASRKTKIAIGYLPSCLDANQPVFLRARPSRLWNRLLGQPLGSLAPTSRDAPPLLQPPS